MFQVSYSYVDLFMIQVILVLRGILVSYVISWFGLLLTEENGTRFLLYNREQQCISLNVINCVYSILFGEYINIHVKENFVTTIKLKLTKYKDTIIILGYNIMMEISILECLNL